MIGRRVRLPIMVAGSVLFVSGAIAFAVGVVTVNVDAAGRGLGALSLGVVLHVAAFVIDRPRSS